MKKLLRFVVPLLLAALVVASIGWYLFVFDREFTRDMLLQQARYHDTNGNSRLSAWFYNMAYAHSGNDEDVAIELANQYKGDGNYTKAEVTLSRAIHSGATADLYAALCKTYVQQDKLMDAVSLLAGITDPDIQAELDARRPTAPAPDQAPGFYSQYIDVALSTSSGTMLYTTNGLYPSIKDTPYSGPIPMPIGETVIYCISVDSSGLVSPLSILGYTVGGVVEPAIFTDSAMEAAVREALNVRSDDVLYTNHLWEIKEFTVPEDARSLDDLGMLANLETLSMKNRGVDSLQVLAPLAKLSTLEIAASRVDPSVLEVIGKLPALKKLTLNDCSISTISGLETAVNLEYLNLANNTIRNLEPLKDMQGLKELFMENNALVDLSIIGQLPMLEKLDISHNSVESLRPLSSCGKLNWLNAATNQLTTVEGVTALPLLTSLSLNFNHLTDVSNLGACIQLKELSINNNNLTTVDALAALSNLEIFDMSYNYAIPNLPDWPEGSALRVIDCSYNALTDLDILGTMQNLTYVSADYNQITDVEELANCPNLVQVNVYGNLIEDVSSLTEQNIIVNYDPTVS